MISTLQSDEGKALFNQQVNIAASAKAIAKSDAAGKVLPLNDHELEEVRPASFLFNHPTSKILLLYSLPLTYFQVIPYLLLFYTYIYIYINRSARRRYRKLFVTAARRCCRRRSDRFLTNVRFQEILVCTLQKEATRRRGIRTSTTMASIIAREEEEGTEAGARALHEV